MAWLHVPRSAVSASSPAGECSTLPCAWPAELSLWCTSSGEHSPRPSSWPGWKSRPWVTLLSGTTSPPSTLARGVAWWISSLAVVPAKTSPSPESGLASMELEAGSGDSSSACLRRQGLLFSSGKTSEEQSGPRSTWLRTTLSASAIELRRALSALQMSEPRTPASDSSSWPTPSAKPYGSNQSPSPGAALRPSLRSLSAQWPTPTATDRKGSGASYPSTATHQQGTTLTDAAVRQWPTPAARDWKGSNGAAHLSKERGHHDQLPNAVAMWPTPTNRADGRRGMPSPEVAQARFESGRRNLDDAVSLWATPMRPSGGRTTTREMVEAKGTLDGVKRQVDLRAQVMHFDSTPGPRPESLPSGPTGVALNPEFVEGLMGLPPRWSSPRTASSSWATASSRSRRPPHSSSAGSDSSEVARDD